MLKLSHPLTLLLASLTYLFGASIPAYLGEPFQATPFIFGFIIVLFAQVSMNFLSASFRPHNEPLIENESPAKIELLRKNLLYVSTALLITSAFLIYLLVTDYQSPALPFFFLLIIIMLYSVPPFRLINRGFGELLLSFQIAYLIPTIAFVLQAHQTNRLLIILIIPLTALAVTYFLILNFTTFSSDEKYQRGTMLRLLTWQRAVPLHHALIVFAYFIFALAPLFGYSFNLIWPAFLTLPFAIFQIVQVNALANGNPPNWKLLTSTALILFGLTTYFLTLTFWLR
ncbi:MAG: 1,4-dihydroxy-2-naphthoate octaprenyltransferase [Chloroflexi bacterium OLB14]|nr:MAG: 1,4-dihydroxy-2-naphthoate octaprenyltransferase [Chloroflexi bacterium OLB14]